MKQRTLILPFLSLIGSAPLALAIGPDYQVVPNGIATGSPVSAVVDFLKNANDTSDFGTGTIINKYTDAGIAYAQVLTADHVASDGNAGYNAWVAIGLNNGNAPTAANVFQEQLLGAQPMGGFSPGLGGPNPGANFEDFDIVRIQLGGMNNPNVVNLYNGITPVNISSPTLNQLGTLGTNSPWVNFTQYGYGYAGKPIVSGGQNGYGSYDKPFTLRFQDNTVTSVDTAYTATGYTAKPNSQNAGNAYFNPTVHYKTAAPPNAQLRGGGLQGDSGGPFLYLSGQQATVTDSATNNITGNVFTDWQYAVFTGGTDTGPVTNIANANPPGGNTSVKASMNGDDQFGVYIDQANYNWIWTIIPEPSSGTLILLGGFILAVVRRHHSR